MMGGCISSSLCGSNRKQEDEDTYSSISLNWTSVSDNETLVIHGTKPQTMTEIVKQNGKGTEALGFDSGSMLLEAFVTYFPLPQRAKVTAGFWDMENENDSDREFAAGEVIHVLQVICPFVNLTLNRPDSGLETRISLGTRFISAKFRVVSHREVTHSSKPRVFHGVEEMIVVWPHTVKALSSHTPGTCRQQPAFRNGDRLRLIRIACLSEGQMVLECKVLRGNMQLLQLPLNYTGNFAEVDDPKGYTLLELVTIARVERTLTIHRGGGGGGGGGPCDAESQAIPGISSDFDGYIMMEKPQLFVQMKRVPRPDDEIFFGRDDEQQQRPFLVPIDCPIDLSPREDTYQCHDCSQTSLKELAAKYSGSTPFLARIIRWDEETTILQQNVVRPGHELIFLKHEKAAKILARDKARDRYYMVPVDHTGSFIRMTHIREDCALMVLNLKGLEKSSFPFDVKFMNAGNPYSNISDCVLSTETTLTFEAYIGEDKAAVVAKLCDGIICNRFHLPLRTRLVFQFERRWVNPLPTDDSLRWSDSENLAEEINGNVYNKLMEKYGDYEWLPAQENPLEAVAKSPRAVGRLPESPRNGSPMLKKKDCSSDDGYLKPSLTTPPLHPRRKNSPNWPQSRSSQVQSPSTGRRGVPPPPTIPREPPPPVPSRIPTSAATAASLHPGQPKTDRCSHGRKREEESRQRGLPPLPPSPIIPAHPTIHVSNHDNNDDETTSTIDSDGQSYTYIDVETLQDSINYRQNRFPGNVATDGVSIPSDGNVSHFTADQMLLFLREIHAPVGTINAWEQLRVDGKDFAKMSDERLQEYRIYSTVVQFFRDRSKMQILLQL